eukprot:CAMPEP_0113684514 /NCGR_PEP_ID=MMETSP0038_2-20120614/14052_1 /TAXON_ID=2898 /ORGANISM="Cryptomonas paramecium" /LENGTH=137 /DNA_ID=CAMNT_0000604285 /DNA_START=75 /DNA_END=489 /DNA_ORIENTATION=+ /assembly_acc=CAM_ASM_000170
MTASIGPANRSEPSSVADSIGTARAHDNNDPACHLEDNVFGALQTKDHALAHHWHTEFQNNVLDLGLFADLLSSCLAAANDAARVASSASSHDELFHDASSPPQALPSNYASSLDQLARRQDSMQRGSAARGHAART